MRTTIDSGGRIVIPKAIRDALSLRADSEVDVALVYLSRNSPIKITYAARIS